MSDAKDTLDEIKAILIEIRDLQKAEIQEYHERATESVRIQELAVAPQAVAMRTQRIALAILALALAFLSWRFLI
jgi:hypothetical protein